MGTAGEPEREAAGGGRLRLDMEIKDFGPIKKADISLRPLTIFIGENDTGKSYAAMLAHSAISAGRVLDRRAYLHSRSAYNGKTLEGVVGGLKAAVAALGSAGRVECPPNLAALIARSAVDGYLARLQGEIMRNFGSDLKDLTRSGARHFSMELGVGNGRIITYRRGGLSLAPLPKPRIVFEAVKAPNRFFGIDAAWDGDDLHCRIASDLINRHVGRGVLLRLRMELEAEILRQAAPALPAHSIYFPAARSGILQAHRVITSNIVRNAPYAGIEDVHVPRLSGVVSDFVSSIIDMHPIRGIHHDTGSLIERDIFGGHVKLKFTDPDTIPEIFYERAKVNVPIHRTSSTISELAPFTLHLKHSVGEPGVLIIEEPEAHLHPRNQSRLAKHIVRLVREGANIIVTTHSSTLFESVSQYLRASLLSPEGRKKALGHEDLYISKDEVAPHLFTMGRGGSVVERVGLSAEYGIEQEEFVKEDRLLSDVNLRLEEHTS